jgi:hypothetical protein
MLTVANASFRQPFHRKRSEQKARCRHRRYLQPGLSHHRRCPQEGSPPEMPPARSKSPPEITKSQCHADGVARSGGTRDRRNCSHGGDGDRVGPWSLGSVRTNESSNNSSRSSTPWALGRNRHLTSGSKRGTHSLRGCLLADICTTVSSFRQLDDRHVKGFCCGAAPTLRRQRSSLSLSARTPPHSAETTIGQRGLGHHRPHAPTPPHSADTIKQRGLGHHRLGDHRPSLRAPSSQLFKQRVVKDEEVIVAFSRPQ